MSTENDSLVTPEEASEVEVPTSEREPSRRRKLKKPADVDRALRDISERLFEELDSQERLDPDAAKKVADVLVQLKRSYQDNRKLAEREKDLDEWERDLEKREAQVREGLLILAKAEEQRKRRA